MKIAVIGAGFAGLSAATYLARDGHDVTVYEKNESAGGRARVMKARTTSGEFVFDLGPSWLMMPGVFESFFADFNRKLADYVEIIKLEPSYKVIGSREIDVSSGKKARKIFESIEPGSGQKLDDFLQDTKEEYQTTISEFLEKDWTGLRSKLDPKMFVYLLKKSRFSSYHNRIAKVVSDPDLQKVLEFMTVFMGGSPSNIPGIYALLAHVDLDQGIWYPKGGFGALVQAYQRLATEMGVKFEFNSNVQAITTEGRKVTGLEVNGQKVSFDIVVSAGDYHHTESVLLGQERADRAWSKKVMSPSGLLIYLAIDRSCQI